MKKTLTNPAFIGIASILIMLIHISQYPNILGTDQGAFLSIAQRIMAGEVPYIDYVQINFPMIQYINVVPHIFADVLGLNVVVTFNMLIAFCIGFSNYTSAIFTQRLIDKKQDWLVWVVPSALLFVSLASFNTYALGQREHLVIIAIFPTLLWRSLRWHSEAFRAPLVATALGIIMGITATLKPHYLPLVFIPEMYWVLSQRKIRPLFTAEVYAFVGLGIAHVLYFVLQPELTAKFIETLALTRPGFAAYGNASIGVMFLFALALPLFVLVFVLGLFLPVYRAGKLWTLARPVSLMGIFSILTYLLQRRGFGYHRLPYEAFGMLLILLMFLYVVNRYSELRKPISARTENIGWGIYLIGIVLFAFVQTSVFEVNPKFNMNEANDYLSAHKDEFERGETILHIDTWLQSAYPIIAELDLLQVATYSESIPLAFGYYDYPDTNYYDPDHVLPEFVADFLDVLATDITVKQPRYIVVRKGRCFGCKEDFRVYDFLEARGVIQDLITPNYAVKADLNNYIIYERNIGGR